MTKPNFPLNAWYAAAWDAEMKHALLPRTICNRKVVMFRTAAGGQVVALEDLCPHRRLPLSMGTLQGDTLGCGRGGLRFDATGRCVSAPPGESIPAALAVRSFPAVERHRFVWLWMGDPALADPALVPDLHWNQDPGWAGDGSTIHGLCDYRLVIDNLMDLTHETFIHGSSIGNDAVAEAPFDVTHGERIAKVSRWMIDIEPPPFLAQLLEAAQGITQPCRVDRWQNIFFQAPNTVAIDVGVAPTGTGAPQGDRSKGFSMWVINTITPETDRTCHYFWANARDFRLGDQAITTAVRNSVTNVFREDELIVAAQQQAIDDHPDHIFYNLNIDAGAMWARRLIDRMIEAELPPPQRAGTPLPEAA
ncbi:Rieske 2Fe-2S domain-containing protein [Roseomonas sp. BN140053]|uniref:aromatic ring-hydroxylating dioxygenase subunit alpha n=1 Tax=Roseomonas sp. BN140053 TaxID=3391898 RepID=UPI0039EBC31B